MSRVCLVTTEILGLHRNGGAGTAVTYLALRLAEAGHEVEILFVGPAAEVWEPWRSRYAERRIRITQVPPAAGIDPSRLDVAVAAMRALAPRPPDAVVYQDFLAPGYAIALAKDAGTAFQETTLVYYSHSSTLWQHEAHRQVGLGVEQLALATAERRSAELADHVVSPSAYMRDWKRGHGWELPGDAPVIPYFTAGALDLAPPPREVVAGEPLDELVFFGRLEERKGVRTFVEALHRLPPELLGRVRVSFLGKEEGFTRASLRSLAGPHVLDHVRGFEVHTGLDQHEANAYLSAPGRLAVMPSHVDNSPCVLYECLEAEIPFLASSTGGNPELIGPGDRDRILFHPDAASLAEQLTAVLRGGTVPAPARPAFSHPDDLAAWEQVLAPVAPRRRPLAPVTVAVVVPDPSVPLGGTMRSVAAQEAPVAEVLVVGDPEIPAGPAGTTPVRALSSSGTVGHLRREALAASTTDLVVFVEAGDELEPSHVGGLVRTIGEDGAASVSAVSFDRDGPRPRRRVPLDGGVDLLPVAPVLGGLGVCVDRRRAAPFVDSSSETGLDWAMLAATAAGGGAVRTFPEATYRRLRPDTPETPTDVARWMPDVLAATQSLADRRLARWPEALHGLAHRVHSLETGLAAAQIAAYRLRSDLAWYRQGDASGRQRLYALVDGADVDVLARLLQRFVGTFDERAPVVLCLTSDQRPDDVVALASHVVSGQQAASAAAIEVSATIEARHPGEADVVVDLARPDALATAIEWMDARASSRINEARRPARR